jgi:CheY-specific phosphatase CheX
MKGSPPTPELPGHAAAAAQPEILSGLVKLISQQNASLDEIARIIYSVPSLQADLLRIAHIETQEEAECVIETVEDALLRHGIGCVVVLVMRTPIAEALVKTFQTMFSLRLTSINPRRARPLEGEHLLGVISFAGNTSGNIFIRLSYDSSRSILGQPPGGLQDATREMLNIMAGNFRANLRAAGLDYQLASPKVHSVSHFALPVKRDGSTSIEHMAFHDGDIQLFLDVTANSWAED